MAQNLLVSLTLTAKDQDVQSTLNQIALNTFKTATIIKDLGDKAATMGQQMGKAGKDGANGLDGMAAAASNIQGLLASIGIGLSVAAISSFVQSTISELVELRAEAAKTNLAVGDLAALDFAFKQLGSDSGTITIAFRGMEKSIADAERGTGRAMEAFSALGITLKDLKTMDPEDIFRMLLNQLGKLKDPVDQDQAALLIFKKSYQELKPVIKEGNDQLEAAIDLQKRLNPVTQATADSAKILTNKWNEAKEAIKGYVNIGMTLLVGAFSDNGGKPIDDVSKVVDKFVVDMKQKANEARAEAGEMQSSFDKNRPAPGGFKTEEEIQAIAKAKEEWKKYYDQIEQYRKQDQMLSVEGINQWVAEQIAAAEKARAAVGGSVQQLDAFKAAITQAGADKIAKIEDEQARKSEEIIKKAQKEIEDDYKERQKAYADMVDVERIQMEREQKLFEDSAAAAQKLNKIKVDLGMMTPSDDVRAAYDLQNQALQKRIDLLRAQIPLEAGTAEMEKKRASDEGELALLTQQQIELAGEWDLAQIKLGEDSAAAYAGMRAGLADFAKQSGTTFDAYRSATKSALDTVTSGFGGMFRSITDGSKPASQAFKDFARSVILDINEIIIKLEIMMAIKGAAKKGWLGDGFAELLGVSAGAAGGAAGGGGVIEAGVGTGGAIAASARVNPAPKFGGAWGAPSKSTSDNGPSGVVINQTFEVKAMDGADVVRVLSRPEAQEQIRSQQIKSITGNMQTRAALKGLR